MSSLSKCTAETPLDQTNSAVAICRSSSWWPDAACWRVAGAYGSGVFLLWLFVYGGANCITGLHDHRVALRTAFDAKLPFMPGAAIVYLSLFPMLWLSPFVLRSPARLRAFAGALARVIAISGIGFLLLPAEPNDASSIEIGTHAFGGIFLFADWINLTHNYFPSLHVGMAVVCAVCYSRAASHKAATLYWLWVAMIAVATLLTRQHYIVDVFAGGVLGTIVATLSDASNSRRALSASGADRV